MNQPLLWVIDSAPLVLGYVGGMLGEQQRLHLIVENGKKEWETIFDSFSDLIFVTDPTGNVIRCNHAVIDRLNTYYANVIGKPISEILSSEIEGGDNNITDAKKGFSWLGHLYSVSMIPIELANEGRQNLFVLRDVTRQKKAEADLEQSESLFRGLFDLSPDAVVVIDPHDPNISWPVIDCNVAACIMNGYEREELVGHSVDILNISEGTADERLAYLNRLHEVESLNIETFHRRKNGEVFPVEVSTT
jgi:PAS domain S-box-containing protein